MSIQYIAQIHQVNVEIFHRISGNSDLLVVLDKKSFGLLLEKQKWKSIYYLLSYFSLEVKHHVPLCAERTAIKLMSTLSYLSV